MLGTWQPLFLIYEMFTFLLRPSSAHILSPLGEWALPSSLYSCSILYIPLRWHLTQTVINCLFSCWTAGIESMCMCVLYPHVLTPLSIIPICWKRTNDWMNRFWMKMKWRKIIMSVLLWANHVGGREGGGNGKAKIRSFIATAVERQQVGGGEEEEEEERKGRKLFQEAVKLLRYKIVPVATGYFTI